MKKRENIIVPISGLRNSIERDDVSVNVLFGDDGSVYTRPGLTEIIWPNDPRPLVYHGMSLSALRGYVNAKIGIGGQRSSSDDPVPSPDDLVPLPSPDNPNPPPYPYDIFTVPDKNGGIELIVKDGDTIIHREPARTVSGGPITVTAGGSYDGTRTAMSGTVDFPSAIRGEEYKAYVQCSGGVPPYRCFAEVDVMWDWGCIPGGDDTVANGKFLESVCKNAIIPLGGRVISFNKWQTIKVGYVEVPRIDSSGDQETFLLYENPVTYRNSIKGQNIVVVDSVGNWQIIGGFIAVDLKKPKIAGKDRNGNVYIGDFFVGMPFYYQLQAVTGTGVDEFRWASDIASRLPAGVTFDAKTGVISGTPTELSTNCNARVTLYDFQTWSGSSYSSSIAHMTDDCYVTWGWDGMWVWIAPPTPKQVPPLVFGPGGYFPYQSGEPVTLPGQAHVVYNLDNPVEITELDPPIVGGGTGKLTVVRTSPNVIRFTPPETITVSYTVTDEIGKTASLTYTVAVKPILSKTQALRLTRPYMTFYIDSIGCYGVGHAQNPPYSGNVVAVEFVFLYKSTITNIGWSDPEN